MKYWLILALAVFVWAAGGRALNLQRSEENLQLVRSIVILEDDLMEDIQPSSSILPVNKALPLWQEGENKTACQHLWLSRLQAKTSLEAA